MHFDTQESGFHVLCAWRQMVLLRAEQVVKGVKLQSGFCDLFSRGTRIACSMFGTAIQNYFESSRLGSRGAESVDEVLPLLRV